MFPWRSLNDLDREVAILYHHSLHFSESAPGHCFGPLTERSGSGSAGTGGGEAPCLVLTQPVTVLRWQRIREATPFGSGPPFRIHDNDGFFGRLTPKDSGSHRAFVLRERLTPKII